jgi:hypothetical protein
MKRVKTEIEIHAPTQTVWDVLANTDAFPEWNPFITRVEGELRPGAHLVVTIAPPRGKAMTFRPTVETLVPGRELTWLGRLLVPGLFDGRHRFALEDIGGGRARFHQEEDFTGILVPLMASALERTAEGFTEMNQALKMRAEAANRGPEPKG